MSRCAFDYCPGKNEVMHEIESGEELHNSCQAEMIRIIEGGK